MKNTCIIIFICLLGTSSFSQESIKIEITEKEQIIFTYNESLKEIDSLLIAETGMIPKYNLFIQVDKDENTRVLLISVDAESTSEYLTGLNGSNQILLELLFNDSEVYADKTLKLPFRSRFKIVLE
jgi:hypothetical protein